MMAGAFNTQFECALTQKAFRGEAVCGDRCLIRFHSEGVLFAVIDGAGHGSEAFAAAAVAEAILETVPGALPGSLLNLCHEGMRSTRGAAISLASVTHELSMNWAGVGNVDVVLLRQGGGRSNKKESLLLRNGVVGYQFTPPRVSTVGLTPGDMIIFVTDGINSRFLEGIPVDSPCQAVADFILNEFGKDSDDALVLVVRVAKGAT